MISARMQQTIAGRAVVAGFGYWSGKDVRIEFRPAAAGRGHHVCAQRPRARRPACRRRSTCGSKCPRRTNLRLGRVEVDMVEHVLAALAGLEHRQLRSVDQPAGNARAATARRRRSSTPCCGPASSQQGVEADRLDVTETVRVGEGESLDRSAARRRTSELSHRISARLSAAPASSAGRLRGPTSRPSAFAASWRRAARSCCRARRSS